MIDVIVPVLGRPENAWPLAESFRTNTPDGATLTFVCTGGDKAQIQAARDSGCWVLVVSFKSGPGDYARKINYGYQNTLHTGNEVVLNGADDIEFTPKWAEIALRMMRGRVGVVATNDMANRQVMRGEFGTHCLISRAYINTQGGTFGHQPGVVLYEGYDHNFVDRELCDAARRRRAFAFAKNSVVQHRHPLWKTAAWDPTYQRGQLNFREDALLFSERKKRYARSLVR